MTCSSGILLKSTAASNSASNRPRRSWLQHLLNSSAYFVRMYSAYSPSHRSSAAAKVGMAARLIQSAQIHQRRLATLEFASDALDIGE